MEVELYKADRGMYLFNIDHHIAQNLSTFLSLPSLLLVLSYLRLQHRIAMELLKMSVHQSNTLGCMHPHLFKICALGALRALEALHKTGHIHRDIKPEVR